MNQYRSLLALHDYVAVKHSSDLTPYRTLWFVEEVVMCFFVVKLKFMVISCEKMHMISILVRYGFRWHSDKPYRTRLRLVRYGLSECHLNPYRTRMDTICISYHWSRPTFGNWQHHTTIKTKSRGCMWWQFPYKIHLLCIWLVAFI